MNPTIERIKFQPGGKVILVLSDRSKLKSSENTVVSLSLAAGVEITESIRSQLETINNYEACLKKALDLLSRRPHGKTELFRKMARTQKYDRQDINKVMEEMERLGYLDDEDFCKLFIEDSFNLKPGDGPAKIKQSTSSKKKLRKIMPNLIKVGSPRLSLSNMGIGFAK